MKKAIALILAMSVIFAFTACTKKGGSADGDESDTASAVKPGDWVTDKDGNVMTTVDNAILIDEEGSMITEVRSNEEGKTFYVPKTTLHVVPETHSAGEGETYPVTTPDTLPHGNTLASKHLAWPDYAVLGGVPQVKKEVDNIDYKKDSYGELVNIYVNELSYKDFLKYVDKLIDAGYVRSEEAAMQTLPEKAKDGQYYTFHSRVNGKILSMMYYTDGYPYHTYDLFLTVSDYDPLEALKGIRPTTNEKG